MARVDRLRPALRALVHDYGVNAVGEMIGEGYTDPEAMRSQLEAGRMSRQQKWFETDYITAKSGRSIDRAMGDGASS